MLQGIYVEIYLCSKIYDVLNLYKFCFLQSRYRPNLTNRAVTGVGHLIQNLIYLTWIVSEIKHTEGHREKTEKSKAEVNVEYFNSCIAHK
jgi:hypothetical protein